MIHIRLLLAAIVAVPAAAGATDVNVIGLFPGKAVVVIDRGAPRTLSVGQRTAEGVLLVSANSEAAVLEIDGKRQELQMGQHFETAAQTGARNSVTLAANEYGHFIVDGAVNGTLVRFIVDTGATYVSMSSDEARRLGIDYRKGQRGYTTIADGRQIPTYRVMLDSLRGAAYLSGVRGQPGMDRPAVVDAIVRLGRLLVDDPDVVEVDANPLISGPAGTSAVDALVVVRDD